jgi:hypothetical protein
MAAVKVFILREYPDALFVSSFRRPNVRDVKREAELYNFRYLQLTEVTNDFALLAHTICSVL